jgi:hypothetical protein
LGIRGHSGGRTQVRRWTRSVQFRVRPARRNPVRAARYPEYADGVIPCR